MPDLDKLIAWHDLTQRLGLIKRRLDLVQEVTVIRLQRGPDQDQARPSPEPSGFGAKPRAVSSMTFHSSTFAGSLES